MRKIIFILLTFILTTPLTYASLAPSEMENTSMDLKAFAIVPAGFVKIEKERGDVVILNPVINDWEVQWSHYSFIERHSDLIEVHRSIRYYNQNHDGPYSMNGGPYYRAKLFSFDPSFYVGFYGSGGISYPGPYTSDDADDILKNSTIYSGKYPGCSVYTLTYLPPTPPFSDGIWYEDRRVFGPAALPECEEYISDQGGVAMSAGSGDASGPYGETGASGAANEEPSM